MHKKVPIFIVPTKRGGDISYSVPHLKKRGGGGGGDASPPSPPPPPRFAPMPKACRCSAKAAPPRRCHWFVHGKLLHTTQCTEFRLGREEEVRRRSIQSEAFGLGIPELRGVDPGGWGGGGKHIVSPPPPPNNLDNLKNS